MLQQFRDLRSGIPALSLTWATLISALFIVSFDNVSFWNEVLTAAKVQELADYWFLTSIFLILISFFTFIMALFSFPILFRPLLIILFIVSALAGYFMDNNGIIIDLSMIRNVAETDPAEASELMTSSLFSRLFVAGFIPSFLVLIIPIRREPFRKGLVCQTVLIMASMLIFSSTVYLSYKKITLIGREHKKIRMLINPVYPIYSFIKYVSTKNKGPLAIAPIAADAARPAAALNEGKKRLVVFVLGETARAKEFSLNGYERETNPTLKKSGAVVFSNVYACGTSTAESLPCIFSHLPRAEYSPDKAKEFENILDVLKRTGVSVLWRDNNSGCKGVCDRVDSDPAPKIMLPEFCDKGECYDDILLAGLDDYLAKRNGDIFIVLHQKGSHGPSYYKRTPAAFKKFLPECAIDNVQDCTTGEIVNAYDNTILYTDHFLGKVIDYLKGKKNRYETAMLYVSDHGESLGEHGIYLHGTPWFIAPDEQIHVPMLLWLSDDLKNKIDIGVLTAAREKRYTHDNLFHTFLGLYDVQTILYDPALDILLPAIKKTKLSETVPL